MKNDILILLSTYNGEKYLSEFLDSIYDQENVKVKLLIRDDGSTDKTVDIIHDYSAKLDIELLVGVNIGVENSYRELIEKASSAKYYFFADQDDIWLRNKVYSAIQKLDLKEPSVYYSSATLIDNNKFVLGRTNLKENFSLEKIFIGNTMIGCTMAFNQTFLNILKETYASNRILHDAWAARIAGAIEAEVFFDKEPKILYRQHGENVVGIKKGFMKRITKGYHTTIRNKNSKSNLAKEVLLRCDKYLSNESRKKIEIIAYYRKNIRYRLSILLNRKYRKDHFIYTILFKISVIMGYF